MLIIGHRGARGLKPENTLESVRAGQAADVDMIEIDVRLTKDKIPILIHDIHLWHTHKLPYLVSRLTYAELCQRTSHSVNPIATLESILQEFGGRIMLNLELKDRGSAIRIVPMVKQYIGKPSDWDGFLFSSWHLSELRAVRKQSKRAQLGIIEWFNPLRFIVVAKRLKLTAVAFHRLHVNPLLLAAAKGLNLYVYAYTVNRPDSAERLARLGVDGIVTDYPDVMVKVFDEKTRRR